METTGASEAARVAALCAYLEQHLDERLTLRALSRQAGLSPFHLQRVFKKRTGLTPRQYVDACRLKALKRGLRESRSVTRAMHDAGYGSTSRLHARSGPELGMTPSEYRDGGAGVGIRYLTAATHLGFLLVAATEKGICAVAFGDSEAELVSALRSEYPAASVAAAGSAPAGWARQLLLQIEAGRPAPELPLDVRATAFQRRVWEHLRRLPYGATASYGEVAAALGNPKAARAVARACAANPAAVAVPCHRVVRGDGGLGGYRWGLERKKRLLDGERNPAATTTA
jgi:AraC family transcriptional regulator of adaptative response/methylated-DNA-[protein]-cysteine methyltransferase